MKKREKRNQRHRLSDAATNDLRAIFTEVGMDSTDFSQNDLNSIGILLLTTHLHRLEIEGRQLNKPPKDAIIDA